MSGFEIGARVVAAGTRETVNLEVSTLANAMPMTLPVHVVHGGDGPVLFLSGVVHGDEIQGLEIVRRVLAHEAVKSLRGTLLAIPIVNAFGFLNHSRYMPDRRDLNVVVPDRTAVRSARRCGPGAQLRSLQWRSASEG